METTLVASPETWERQAQDYTETFDKIIAWVQNDPAHAIGTFGILLLFAAFFAARKRVGENLLGFSDKLLSTCTRFAIRFFSDFNFGLRYKKHVIFEHRLFNVRGLRTMGTFTVELASVYVDLRIEHSAAPNNQAVHDPSPAMSYKAIGLFGIFCARVRAESILPRC